MAYRNHLLFALLSVLFGSSLAAQDIPISDNPSRSKPAPAKPVEQLPATILTWTGDQTVKIYIVNDKLKDKPVTIGANEQKTVYIAPDDGFRINVDIGGDQLFKSRGYSQVKKTKGYLTIGLKNGEVTVSYKTEKDYIDEKTAAEKEKKAREDAEKENQQKQAEERQKQELEAKKRDEEIKQAQLKASRQKLAADAIVKEISSKMVLVDGGTFTMGCNKDQGLCLNEETPTHQVTLRSFYICKYDVTQQQYSSLMENNPSNHQNCPQCPVENVTWDDAILFISNLNELAGTHLRLPTEAEWEYAARGGSKSKNYKYAGGNTLDEVAWYDANSKNNSQPVSFKSPNELGLYDMTGNVAQWCSDWFSSDYYAYSPNQDPSGPETGDKRVIRGGAWFYNENSCRISFRSQLIPTGSLDYLGFRLVSDGQ